MNYQQMLRQFNQTQEEAKEEASKELEEKRKNVLELTQPFEALGFESFGKLFKKGVVEGGKKALAKLGLTEDKARALKKAYDENGHKGVLNELKKSLPSTKKDLDVKPSAPPSTRPQLSESSVEELLPEEFKKTEGVIKNSLKSRISDLTGDQQQEFTDKIGKRYIKDLNEFGGDKDLARQYNLNQASRTLDEVEQGEKLPFSINSLSKSEYSDPIIRESLIGAVKQERDDLHPLYRQQFNNLMKDRLATKDDIADDLLREKFNLHQASRTLDEVKQLSPAELLPKEDLASSGTKDLKSAFTNTLSDVGSIGNSNPTQSVTQQVGQYTRRLQGDVGDFESNVIGQAKQATTTIFRTNEEKLLSQEGRGFFGNAKSILQNLKPGTAKIGEDVAADEAKQVAKKATEKAVGKAVGKGAEVGSEAVAEGGGPEDLIGDVVGAIAGIATTLGGVFGSRHIHAPAVPTVSNVAYQIGA